MQESIAAFLAQTHGEKELIVMNTLTRQKLEFDNPLVRIVNLSVPHPPMRAYNRAVEEFATGDVIICWSELDYYLPNFLSTVAHGIEGFEWCLLSKEVQVLPNKTVKAVPSSELSFAATKKAIVSCGGFGSGMNGASERNLLMRITTRLPGNKVDVPPSGASVVRKLSLKERDASKPTIRCGKIVLYPAPKSNYSSLSAGSDSRANNVCVVELGRYGDIINILPFLKHIHDHYKTPALCVAQEFADLLDGVSYVKPFVVPLKNEELSRAIELSESSYKIVVNAQIWGRGWQQKRETESYNMESFRNCGILNKFNDKNFFPVFDRRDPQREAMLIELAKGGSNKPMILVNVGKAVSSPCEHCKILMDEIRQQWLDYNIVDLSEIKADRLYDFIGLMEKSALLVCIDTSFLHLAAATNIPVVAITNPKEWAGTIVRGNIAGQLTYNQVKDDPRQIHECIATALQCFSNSAKHEPSVIPNKVGRIFHCVERHHEKDGKYAGRKSVAWNSWDTLYSRGLMIPAHYWNYSRTADKEVGDPRPLPYLKDLFKFALDQMDEQDVMLWTNDDNPLHPEVAEYIKFHVGVYGACTSFRSEFSGEIPPLTLTPKHFDQGSQKHMGRDIFAATKRWMIEHWDEIPDFIIGCSDFDLCLAAMIRNQHGLPTTNKNISELMFPAEIMRGYVAHQYHQSHWSRPGYQDSAPGQKHNRKLFREWAEKHCPTLVFNENNTLK